MLAMKKHLIINKYIGAAILLLAATPAWAADDTLTAPAGNLNDTYRIGEFSADGFGTASLGKYTLDHLSGARVYNNTRLGAGLGLNYFFTRFVGMDAEAYSENSPGAWVDSASVNLLLRYPVGDSGFAPYALGGAGYRFDDVTAWFGELGAGMEYRFTPHMGVFLDARAVLPDETRTYGLARLGVRFAF
jgi:hypothetical protein